MRRSRLPHSASDTRQRLEASAGSQEEVSLIILLNFTPLENAPRLAAG